MRNSIRSLPFGVLTLIGLASFAGCGAADRGGLGYGPPPAARRAEFGAASAPVDPVEFYFYLNSDSDILGSRPDGSIDHEGEILSDQLRTLAASADFGIHIYLDRGTRLPGGNSRSDSERYERCGEAPASSTALGETDSGDPKHLRELVEEKCFPNAKRFVVLWSHGDGFRAQPTFDDSEPGRRFHISNLLAAIPDGFADAVLFDSCAMANLEIASLLDRKAKWMLASQFELPSIGIQYADLSALLARTRDTVAILSAIRADSERAFATAGLRAPLVVVDLSKIPAIRTAFSAAWGAAAETAESDYATFRDSVLRGRDGDLFFLFTRFAPKSLPVLAAALESGRGSLHFALPRARDRDDDLDAVAEAAPEVFRTWSENFPNWAAYARFRISPSPPADVSNVSYPPSEGVRL